MVSTKKTAKEYTQKEMGKEFTCFTAKQQNNKINPTKNKIVMQEIRDRKGIQKTNSKTQMSLFINKFFKCKWIKHSNQKTKLKKLPINDCHNGHNPIYACYKKFA